MAVAEKVTITVPLEVDADDLWRMIFGSEFETWDWWYAYTNFQGGDWEHHCLAEVYHIDEEDDYRHTFQLRIDDIAHSLLNQDFDAGAADMVIQQACFGEVVYG